MSTRQRLRRRSAFVIGGAGRGSHNCPEQGTSCSHIHSVKRPAPRGGPGYLERGSDPMCDYSLHALATRPAVVGETLISTTFRGTSTRGFASEREPTVAVCLLPGTELALAEDPRYDNRRSWTRSTNYRSGKSGQFNPDVQLRNHDA